MSSYGKTTHTVPYIDGTQSFKSASYDAGVYNNGFPDKPTAEYLQGMVRVLVDERYGSSVPNYKKLIADGKNATSNFLGRKQTIVNAVVSVEGRGSNVPGNYSYSYMRKAKRWWDVGLTPPALATTSMMNEAQNIAQTKFYKSYASALSLFEGGTALAELRETLHMIRNPAKALRGRLDDYLSDIKKYRKGSPAGRKRMLGETWLEYSFGWAPLLNDIESGMNYLDKRQKQLTNKFVRISGSGSVSDHSTVSETLSRYLGCQLKGERHTVRTGSVRYMGAVRSSVTGGGVLNMSSLGLSPRSFVPTLWEVIPYSFAVDYFSNIGDVITAYSNGVAKLAWGCKTTRRESILTAKCVEGDFALAEVLYQRFVGGNGMATNLEVSRSSIDYVPLPDVSFEIPGLGTKWINLAALLATKKSLSPF